MSDTSTSNGDWSELPQIPTDLTTEDRDFIVESVMHGIEFNLGVALRLSKRGSHVYRTSALLYAL